MTKIQKNWKIIMNSSLKKLYCKNNKKMFPKKLPFWSHHDKPRSENKVKRDFYDWKNDQFFLVYATYI